MTEQNYNQFQSKDHNTLLRNSQPNQLVEALVTSGGTMPVDIEEVHMSIVCMCTNEMINWNEDYDKFCSTRADNETVMKCPSCQHMIHIYSGVNEPDE